MNQPKETDLLRYSLFIMSLCLPIPGLAEDPLVPVSHCQMREGKMITAQDQQGNEYRYCIFKNNSYCSEQQLNRRKCRPGKHPLPPSADNPSQDETQTLEPTSTPQKQYCVQQLIKENGTFELYQCP